MAVTNRQTVTVTRAYLPPTTQSNVVELVTMLQPRRPSHLIKRLHDALLVDDHAGDAHRVDPALTPYE